MTTKIRLQCGVASSAIATAALGLWLAGTVTPARAQQGAGAPAGATEVAIDADDIGGVVSGPADPRPASGSSPRRTELPTSSVADRRDRRSGPLSGAGPAAGQLQRLGARLWSGRLAEDDARARPAARSHGRAGAERRGCRALLPGDLLVLDADDPGPERVRRRERHPGEGHAAGLADARSRTGPASAATSSARIAPARFRPPFGTFKTGEDAWMRRVQSGQAATFMVNPLAGQLGGAPFKYFGDWTDRIAKGELPHAQAAAAAGARSATSSITALGLGRREAIPARPDLDRQARNPTVNAYGPLYGSPEYCDRRSADPRPGDEHGHQLPRAGARSRHAASRSGPGTPRPRSR